MANVAKERIKNKLKLPAIPKSPNAWNTVPSTKPSKEIKFNDRAVSIKTFEAFCDTSFDAAPSAKPIDTCRSVFQELDRTLKQIDESAKIVRYSLTLERAQDGYVAPPDFPISDAEFIPKFLTKLSKLFLQCKP